MCQHLNRHVSLIASPSNILSDQVLCRYGCHEQKYRKYIGFEVFVSLIVKIVAFWVVTPRSFVVVYRRFTQISVLL
jgi:hypothetical protein